MIVVLGLDPLLFWQVGSELTMPRNVFLCVCHGAFPTPDQQDRVHDLWEKPGQPPRAVNISVF